MTTATNPILDAARQLLHRGDDGGIPQNRNGVGFNRIDYPFVRDLLAEIDVAGLTRRQAFTLVKVLRRYQRQLGELNISLAMLSQAAYGLPEESEPEPESAREIDGWFDGEPESLTDPDADATPAPTSMADILGQGGVIARALPGYESRPQQVVLAQAIADAIRDEKAILAEAGTGTGKSLAYLIPAIYSGKKTIVSTEGKALQDQLSTKDLPFLQAVLPVGFRFAVLKGISNYACLAGETRVLTRHGAREIKDIAGQIHEIRDGNGQWVKAEVRSFGVQRLLRLTLNRFGFTKVLYATPEHRWLIHPNANYAEFVETTTASLRPGHKLASVAARPLPRNPRLCPSPFGIAHGIVYGDGTVFHQKWSNTATVVLHGSKANELGRFFPESRAKHGHREGYTDPHVRICDLPQFFKERPNLDEAPSYLYGWLAGYFATDGSIHNGQAVLSSACREHLEFVRDVCTRLGIVTNPIRSIVRQGKGVEPTPLYSVVFARATLGDQFFVRESHRSEHLSIPTAKHWRVARRWTVADVQETDRIEEVYCAIVPTTHSFVLEDDLLTGNCLWAWDEEAPKQALLGEAHDFAALRQWLAETKSGDLAEAPVQPSPELRQAITVSSDECLGQQCPYSGCFAMAARRAAKDAQIVVVNHTLLALDLALRDATDDGASVLPDREIVIVDESHALESVATSAFTDEISDTTVASLLRGRVFAKAGLDDSTAERARERSDLFFALLRRQVGQNDRASAAVVTPTPELRLAAENLSGALSVLADRARESATRTTDDKDAEALRRYAKRLTDRGDLFLSLSVKPEATHVLFCERECTRQGRERLILKRAPISVADDLRSALWDKWPVVATSATLSTHGNFTYFRERTGCDDAGEITVDSPFDFRRNALIYLPPSGSLFDPSKYYQSGSVEYFDRLGDQIEQLLLASDGRAFCLFTSRKALDEVFSRIAGRLRWNVYKQGDASPQRLIEQFKADGHGVLFGLRSFWAGVDVQGEALSLVVIDKLPFPTPDEPVYQARCDLVNRQTGDQWAWFKRLALPLAVIQFKQGFGRAIRSKTDRAVLALLDGRLTTRSYGVGILRSLPPAMQTRSIEAVKQFFAR